MFCITYQSIFHPLLFMVMAVKEILVNNSFFFKSYIIQFGRYLVLLLFVTLDDLLLYYETFTSLLSFWGTQDLKDLKDFLLQAILETAANN